MKFLNEKMTLSFEKFEDKCHRLALSVANTINVFLDKYGFEIDYIESYEDYSDELEGVVGLFLASEQDNASVFPMVINIKFLYDYFMNKSDDHFGDELDWAIESTMWHEAGHGIVAYLSDFYDFDWDEEDVVEDFARCMCDGVEQCELVNILEEFSNETFEESYTPSKAQLEALETNGMSIEGVTTPEELMDWMVKNITYELANDDYGAENDPLTKTAEEVLKTGTGHCAEQSYLEKEVLENLGYEAFLVMVKENNSKKDYGADGSAHVFLVYKEGTNYCWFEHSMQHSKGIHKYTSLEALLQDVANQWWRYDENSDILEVRFIDKCITGVDNWGLAQECYKYPVKYSFDISDNIMESDVPLEEKCNKKNIKFTLVEGKNLEQTVQQYVDKYNKIIPLGEEDQELHRNQVMGLIEIDPTYKKGSNTTGDYAIWILNLAIKNGWDVLGTKDKVLPLLSDFIDKKSLLKNKDINSYKTLDDLQKALSEVQLTDRQKERRVRNASSMIKKVLSTENWDVYMALNWAGALTLGKGTHWCTADSENAAWYIKYVMDYWYDENIEAFEVKDCLKHHITVEELLEYPKYLYGEYEGDNEVTSEEEIYAQYSDRAVFVDVQGEGFFVNPFDKLEEDSGTPYNRLFVFVNKTDGRKYQFCMSEDLASWEEDLEYALTFCNSADRPVDFREFIGHQEKELRAFWENVMGYSMQELFSIDPDMEEEDIEESLTEGIEDMKKYYPNVSDDEFQSLVELDPTYREGNSKAGKYAKWILGLANNGKIENKGHITDLLKRFHSEKSRLVNKDIMKYRSMQELEDALNDNSSYKELSDRQQLRKVQKSVQTVDLDKDAELVYENSTWEIWTPKTYEASCKLGRETQWCTASTSSDYYFKYYTNKGPLYININKSTGEKLQFHFPTESFMDATDTEIDINRFFFDNEELLSFYEGCVNSDFIESIVSTLDGYKKFKERLDNNDGVYIYDPDEMDALPKEYTSLITEVLVKGVDLVEPRHFDSMLYLEKVVVADGVERLCSRSFSNCPRLKTVIIGEGLTRIGIKAFFNCTNLTTIELPSTLTIIKPEAFLNCSSLTDVKLPDGIVCICSNSFGNCVNLKHITIPSRVTHVGDGAFTHCSKLSDIEWNTEADIPFECFKACGVTSIKFGGAPRKIASCAFSQCRALRKIKLPEGLVELGREAFFLCSDLAEVFIPSSVASLGSYAFEMDTKLITNNNNPIVKEYAKRFNYTYETTMIRKDVVESVNKFRFRLTEDIDAVKKHYQSIDDETFMTLIALDPTYNPNRDSVGTYGKWILTLYNKGEIKEDDFENVTQMLDVWETNKKRFSNKDIGQFKTLKQLEDALLNMPDLELSHRQKVRQNQKARKYADLGKDATLVLDTSKWEVYTPHTYAASCKLGQGANWCTASTEEDTYYKDYSEKGQLYIIISKQDESEKYQFHFQTQQYMDKNDNSISIVGFLQKNKDLSNLFMPMLLHSVGLPIDTNTEEEIRIKLSKQDIFDILEGAYDGTYDYIVGEDAYNLLYDPEEFIEGYYQFDYFTDFLGEAIRATNDKNKELISKLGIDPEDIHTEVYSDDSKLFDIYIEAIENSLLESTAEDANWDAITSLENSIDCVGGLSGYFSEVLPFTVSGDLEGFVQLASSCCDYVDIEDIDVRKYDIPVKEYIAYWMQEHFELKQPSGGWGTFEHDPFNTELENSLKNWYAEELI